MAYPEPDFQVYFSSRQPGDGVRNFSEVLLDESEFTGREDPFYVFLDLFENWNILVQMLAAGADPDEITVDAAISDSVGGAFDDPSLIPSTQWSPINDELWRPQSVATSALPLSNINDARGTGTAGEIDAGYFADTQVSGRWLRLTPVRAQTNTSRVSLALSMKKWW